MRPLVFIVEISRYAAQTRLSCASKHKFAPLCPPPQSSSLTVTYSACTHEDATVPTYIPPHREELKQTITKKWKKWTSPVVSTCENFRQTPLYFPTCLFCKDVCHFPGLIELPSSSKGVYFNLHSRKDQVASGACGVVAQSRKGGGCGGGEIVFLVAASVL